MKASSIKIAVSFLLGIAAGVAGLRAAEWYPLREDTVKRELQVDPEVLADHPEVLERVRTVMLNRRLTSEGTQRQGLIEGKWQSLVHAAFTPTIGTPDAPRVLLEFTDYTCAPCRASAPLLREGLAKISGTRVAILPLPIGGAMSDYAARIAVAAYRQNPERFAELHIRLMESRGALTQNAILDALRDLHFDAQQVEHDSESDEIRHYMEQVRSFAEDMKVSAVPSFVVGNRMVLGGVSATQVESLLATRSDTKPVKAAVPDRSVGDEALPNLPVGRGV